MTRVLVVLAHPNEKSFNHAIANTAAAKLRENGHEVVFHDLYAEQFDPMLPTGEIPEGAPVSAEVEAHCKDLVQAEAIIIVHPNWWGQLPAILKGWVDRVFRPGVAYQPVPGEALAYGLLKTRVALVFTTSDTPNDRERELLGDPLQTIWKNCIFRFCGVMNAHRTNYSVIAFSTPAQREAWLADVERTIDRHLPKG
jgi:putative NADPH-quinone reductase